MASAHDVIWTLADRDGTIRDLGKAGAPIEHIVYDPYGHIDTEAAADQLRSKVAAGYLGMFADPWSDFYWEGAANYDSLSGRYLGEQGGGANPYVFRNNSPVDRMGVGKGTGLSSAAPTYWESFADSYDDPYWQLKVGALVVLTGGLAAPVLSGGAITTTGFIGGVAVA